MPLSFLLPPPLQLQENRSPLLPHLFPPFTRFQRSCPSASPASLSGIIPSSRQAAQLHPDIHWTVGGQASITDPRPRQLGEGRQGPTDAGQKHVSGTFVAPRRVRKNTLALLASPRALDHGHTHPVVAGGHPKPHCPVPFETGSHHLGLLPPGVPVSLSFFHQDRSRHLQRRDWKVKVRPAVRAWRTAEHRAHG